jgi:hypothetical protein
VRLQPPQPVDASGATTDAAIDVPAATPRNLVVAASPQRRRANSALLFALACALAGVVGLLYLFQISVVAGYGIELTRLQREIDAQSVRNQELSFQLAYYESLPVIEELAIERLGMQPLTTSIYLEVQRPPATEQAASAKGEPDSSSTLGWVVDRLFGRAVADDEAFGSGE